MAAALLLIFILFGWGGLRTIGGFAVVFFVPCYLLTGLFFSLPAERVVFAVFGGLVIMPSLVYWLSLVVPFRIALGVVWMLLVVVWFLLSRKKHS